MPVQSRAQPLLIQEMGNETNTTTEHKQSAQNAVAQIVLGLLGRKGAAVAQQVDEADGDAAVDVEDQVVLFARRHRLDRLGVVEHGGAREVLVHVLLDERDAQIGVVARLDAVANAGDWDAVSGCVEWL